MQSVETAQYRAFFHRFVISLPRLGVHCQRRAAFDKHLHGVLFREIMLGVVVTLAQVIEQIEHVRFGKVCFRFRKIPCDSVFFLCNTVIGVKVAFVVQHDAGESINENDPCKKERKISMQNVTPFSEFPRYTFFFRHVRFL